MTTGNAGATDLRSFATLEDEIVGNLGCTSKMAMRLLLVVFGGVD